MDLPIALSEALRRDQTLAFEHDVEFTVVSRLAGTGPGRGQPPPDVHGTFNDPTEAITLGRSLTGRDVTVVADGHGPYWHSGSPDHANTELLEMVCRDKRLGPHEADLEHRRRHWRNVTKKLEADSRLAEATELARRCESFSEAEHRLQEPPLSLSALQAKHLLVNRHLRLVTDDGKRQLVTDIEIARRSLENVEPFLPEPAN